MDETAHAKERGGVILTQLSELDEWQEPMPLHAQPGAIASSLADGLDIATILRAHLSSAILGLVGGILFGAAIFMLGYQIGYATGTMLTDYRHLAWIVPAVTFLIAWGNRRGE